MREVKIKGKEDVFSVDDDPMFQEILAFAYSMSGLENKLVQLSSGYECIEKLEEIRQAGGALPSAILMDINMPGMTGIETVMKIREAEHYNQIPIITMLSSSNETNDIERAMSAGANSYCEKPFDITTLKFING